VSSGATSARAGAEQERCERKQAQPNQAQLTSHIGEIGALRAPLEQLRAERDGVRRVPRARRVAAIGVADATWRDPF
jgi:hypothetical protein